MGNRKTYLINQIVRVCQKLDQKNFGANHDGNVSVRYDDSLLATPTSMSKGDIVPEMIITLDMDGNKVEGIGKPFSEIKLHLAAYRARRDMKAVVHAHPPIATARGLAGEPLCPSLPEAIVSIGEKIPVVDYAMPGAPENNDGVAKALAACDVLMMKGNGVLSVGTDLEQAYLRLELVEHLAKIDFYARQMGAAFELPSNDHAKLMEKHNGLFGNRGSETLAEPEHTPENADPLQQLIANEIRKALS